MRPPLSSSSVQEGGEETDDNPLQQQQQHQPSRQAQHSTEPTSNTPASCVQVAVRIRPLLASEADSDVCLETFQHSIRIGGPTGIRFSFDHVLDKHATQVQVFDTLVHPLVRATLEGYNATVLAYGQTGSGKTHTVMGHSMEMMNSMNVWRQC